jgi:uncharacterized protein (DUF1810 family)
MAQYDLQRFLSAQAGSYATALAEISSGKKRSHWMWFIFPQLAGLGVSEMNRRYAISNIEEATAYLQHPVLGARIIEISEALLQLQTTDAHAIFGSPDDRKLRSCLTLFSQVPNADPVFQKALNRFYNGVPDPRTLELLENGNEKTSTKS